VDADKVDAVCGESYQCKYDYSTTLNMEFALFTKYYQDQFINIREGVLKPSARGKQNSLIVYFNICRNINGIDDLISFPIFSGLLWNFVHAWKRKKKYFRLYTWNNGEI
jgi:hypothetical protein